MQSTDHHCAHLTCNTSTNQQGAQVRRWGAGGAASPGGREMNIINEKDKLNQVQENSVNSCHRSKIQNFH